MSHATSFSSVSNLDRIDLILVEFNVNDHFMPGKDVPHALEDKGPWSDTLGECSECRGGVSEEKSGGWRELDGEVLTSSSAIRCNASLCRLFLNTNNFQTPFTEKSTGRSGTARCCFGSFSCFGSRTIPPSSFSTPTTSGGYGREIRGQVRLDWMVFLTGHR